MWFSLTHLVLSHYVSLLATAFIDAWGCTSTLLIVDWLTGCVCVDAMVMGLLCQRVTHWHFWFVCLHGTLYPMTDLYYTCYDWLLLSTMMPPFPVAVILSLWYHSYWMLLFTYNTSPTTCSTWVTVLQTVDVTHRLMWPSAICISSMHWTPRLSSLVFFLYTWLPIPAHAPLPSPWSLTT